MPRAARLPSRVPLKLVTVPIRPQAPKGGPRLWNAKERISVSRGLHPEDFKLVDFQESWWQGESATVKAWLQQHPQLSQLSEDVQDFIATNPGLTAQQVQSLLRYPSKYFSFPKNVPLEDRQQVYFPHPNDSVVLMRTPHLGPRHAAFDVPLHFNKLDMRSYLKNVYNVDVLHVRSSITQGKIHNLQGLSRHGAPRRVRNQSEKKMTVLLAKPFVYPEEIKDLSEWEHDEYWKASEAMVKQQRRENMTTIANDDLRTSLAKQAKQVAKNMIETKKFTPTWQEFEQLKRPMLGAVTSPPKSQSQYVLPSRRLNSPSISQDSTKTKTRQQQALPMR